MAFLVWAASSLGAASTQKAFNTKANVMIELAFTADRNYADPFNEVTLDAVFIDPRGRESRVPAFWAGSTMAGLESRGGSLPLFFFCNSLVGGSTSFRIPSS